jgi:4-alpha-glucanotransferase
MTSPLHELSARVGILAEYVDQFGETRATSDKTRIAILAAMGLDAHDDAEARRTLQLLDARERERILPPVRVVRVTDAWDSAIRFRIPEPWASRAGGRVAYICELREEGGETMLHEGVVERSAGPVIDVGLAPLVALGYHQVRLTLQSEGEIREAEQLLIVAPSSCTVPARRAFGVVANLYTLRSERNWGVGNFGDLAELAEWSAERGAAFVGVNPLHALRNRGLDISPYSPVSRLFRNPIYLDIDAIPELAESREARAILASEPLRAELERLRASERVQYERIAALQRPVLRALHRAFATNHRGGGDARADAYERYLERQGEALTTFALYRALEEHFTGARAHPPPWQEWPEPYQTPSSPEVAAFRQSHPEEIDFHRWVQFELDRQLGEAARRGREAGLGVGLYQDLAIGSAANGSDSWAYPHLFLSGVSLGAPPDDYSATGQDWGLPPISPYRLYETRYAYWIALLRSTFRHAGALRIDHVLGLFRQFWIPEGKTGREGAYVRFPTNDLFGILALESARHRALVVGEDLGTVPPEVPGTLEQWGVLGTRVLLFERESNGSYRPASAYSRLSLATADTHDMAPLAGFWLGRDIDIRRELGLMETDEQEGAAREQRERDRRSLLALLTANGSTEGPGVPANVAELSGAVHRFLCATPAVLVGISLDDLTGETEPVNVPGVSADRFPSWTRRMRTPIESLRTSVEVDVALQCERMESV